MRRLTIGLVLLVSLATILPAAARAQPAEHKLPLLIVDGMNNHDWPRATGILKEILSGSGLFAVDVSTSPADRDAQAAWDGWRPDFKKYAVVVSNFNGGHLPTSRHWPKDLEKVLEDYVAGGGGLVIYHSANNSFPNWPAYNEMIGLGWRDKSFGPSLIVAADEKIVTIPKGEGRNPGHGPEHDFLVTVRDRSHPITSGLPRTWMHPHEQLTHGQHGPAKNLTVLTYAYSKDAKENEPMDWVAPYGKGRVYVTMLGHLWKNGPDTAMRCVGFQTLLIRGCQWAATGKVTYPVPKDFPTAEKMSLTGQVPPAGQTSMKGWELYIWQQDGATYYSLLMGTNRLKTEAEITAAAVKGIEAIKPQLAKLQRREMVFPCGRRLPDAAPAEPAKAIRDYCKGLGLEVGR